MSPKQQLPPDEYRRRLLLERRKAMRTVRNTLLVIAILGLGWWAILLIRSH